jgi:hypothetical protein
MRTINRRLLVCQASIECWEQETRQGSPYMPCSQMELDILLPFPGGFSNALPRGFTQAIYVRLQVTYVHHYFATNAPQKALQSVPMID